MSSLFNSGSHRQEQSQIPSYMVSLGSGLCKIGFELSIYYGNTNKDNNCFSKLSWVPFHWSAFKPNTLFSHNMWVLQKTCLKVWVQKTAFSLFHLKNLFPSHTLFERLQVFSAANNNNKKTYHPQFLRNVGLDLYKSAWLQWGHWKYFRHHMTWPANPNCFPLNNV